jgi:hypothetical protein
VLYSVHLHKRQSHNLGKQRGRTNFWKLSRFPSLFSFSSSIHFPRFAPVSSEARPTLAITSYHRPAQAPYPIRSKSFLLFLPTYLSTALLSRSLPLFKFSRPVITQHSHLRRFILFPPHSLHCARFHQSSQFIQAPDSLPNRPPHQHASLGIPGVHSRSK